MTERSQYAVRPSLTHLPRASQLSPEGAAVKDADRERVGERDDRGRFSSGNVVGRGRGWKRAVAKMIGRTVDDPTAQAVADDGWRIFAATLRELPSDGPTVRSLAASRARHVALECFWSAQAVDVGLTTAEGIAAQSHALKHGQRAERLAVTLFDMARALAKPGGRNASELPPWLEYVDEPTPADEKPDAAKN